MKIVYILDCFPVVSQSFVLNEIIEMQRKGEEVAVISLSSPKDVVTHPQVRDVRNIHYMDQVGKLRNILAHFIFFKHPLRYLKTILFNPTRTFLKDMYAVNLINSIKFNHIHAHFAVNAADVALLTYRITGVPFSFTSHRFDIYFSPPKNYFIKSTLAKQHITISEYNKSYLINTFNIPPEKITVIHCGINFRKSFPPRVSEDTNIIVAIARLEKVKGLDCLIKACSKLKKAGFKFQCLIVGEGSERESLEFLIKELELSDDIHLLGAQTQDEVFSLLAKATMKVLPSRSEGIPVSLMEAMAMKVPVIGPDVNGVPELIEDGLCGFLVPAEDIDLLSLRMKTLLQDKSLALKFAEQGYQKVKKDFDLKTETDKLLAIWSDKTV